MTEFWAQIIAMGVTIMCWGGLLWFIIWAILDNGRRKDEQIKRGLMIEPLDSPNESCDR